MAANNSRLKLPAAKANAPSLSDTDFPLQPPEAARQFGRYRLVRKLGQGAMGAVFLALDSRLDRLVALKIPQCDPGDGREFLKRFEREALAAATLTHPNICSIYDVGEIEGRHYLTMAYIEGKPLSEFVRSGEPMDQRSAAAVVRKLALAMAEAHGRGVVHRDLKPANIMIRDRREPIIMDFGLARRVNKDDARLTQSGSIVGTPAYMSPEQVEGATGVGPACDIYSLGVILYELLAGQLPFDGPLMAVLAQIVMKDPEPVSRIRPDVDPALEFICMKAMAKKPGERFASMAEMAARLTNYLQPVANPNPPSGKVKSLASVTRRRSAHVPPRVRTPVPSPLAGAILAFTKSTILPWGILAVMAGLLGIAVLAVALYVAMDRRIFGIQLNDPRAAVKVKVERPHPAIIASVTFMSV